MIINRFLGVLLVSTVVGTSVKAETRAIDLKRSSLTVRVFKSGLFSAPIASGSVEDGAAPMVEISVDARLMTVLDPDLAPEKRSEV